MINNDNPIIANDSSNNNTKSYQFTITGAKGTTEEMSALIDITDNALEPCNVTACYSNSLPGILNPTENSSSGSNINGVVGDLDDGSNIGSSGKLDSKVYADLNGDVNVRIDGPFDATIDPDPVTTHQFKVFISKENAREKVVVYEKTGFGVRIDENDGSIIPGTAVIYSEYDPKNPKYVYMYLKLVHTDLLLARGTYVIRIYKQSEPGSDTYNAVKAFTLTVRSDPIQGRCINSQYIHTANRL